MANDDGIENNCVTLLAPSRSNDGKSIKTITNEEAEAMLKKIFNAKCLTRNYRMLILWFISISPILSFSLGIVFIVKRHFYYCGLEFGAALIPSIYLTICNRIWTNKFYKPDNACIHFMTGIVFAIFNIETLYYYRNNLLEISKNDANFKKGAIFKNDCRDFLCCALILQALTQIGVQSYILWDYSKPKDMWCICEFQIFILCHSTCAFFVVYYLYSKYDFCVGLGRHWRVSLFDFIIKISTNLMYILDVILDWLLVYEYLSKQKWICAGLTLLFIIGPSFAISWMVSDTVKLIKLSECIPGLKWMIFSFSAVPIMQRITYFTKMLKVKKLEIHEDEHTNDELSNSFKKFTKRGYEVEAANAMETYMENSMQVILQLAIVVSNKEYDAVIVTKITLSLLSIGASLIFWNRQVRISENVSREDSKPADELDTIQKPEVIILAVINELTIVPRILAFGLFASLHPTCTGTMTAAWIIASWAIVVSHLSYKRKYDNIKELCLIFMDGIVFIFKPIFEFTCGVETMYYIFYLFQNISLISIWYSYSATGCLYALLFCIIAPILGCILHCIYMDWLDKKEKKRPEDSFFFYAVRFISIKKICCRS